MADSSQFITFEISTVPLMLPAKAVIKVLNATPNISRSLCETGVVPAGQQLIRWLNIQNYLPGELTFTGTQYLIIIRGKGQELLGILADSLPEIGVVSTDCLKALPSINSHDPMLKVVSHVAFNVEAKYFLLNIERILHLANSLE